MISAVIGFVIVIGGIIFIAYALGWFRGPAIQQSQQPLVGRYCPNCGQEVAANARFCQNGGQDMHVSVPQESSPDTDTFGYIPQEKDIFLNQVNPGVTVPGEVIFSVAPDASGFKLEVQDTNYFSTAGKADIDLGF